MDWAMAMGKTKNGWTVARMSQPQRRYKRDRSTGRLMVYVKGADAYDSAAVGKTYAFLDEGVEADVIEERLLFSSDDLEATDWKIVSTLDEPVDFNQEARDIVAMVKSGNTSYGEGGFAYAALADRLRLLYERGMAAEKAKQSQAGE